MDESIRIERAVAAAATVFAVIVGYFTSPLLPYVSSGWIQIFGIMLAMGISFAWGMVLLRMGSFLLSVALAILVLMGAIGLTYNFAQASTAATNNDARCLNIQTRMLATHPDRPDLPAMFEALHCRPQGNEDLQPIAIVSKLVPAFSPSPHSIEKTSRQLQQRR